jgi:hypothetical protein
MVFCAGREQTANTTESKAAAKLPKITLLDIRLARGEAFKVATAATKATIRKETAIISKVTSLIAIPQWLKD